MQLWREGGSEEAMEVGVELDMDRDQKELKGTDTMLETMVGAARVELWLKGWAGPGDWLTEAKPVCVEYPAEHGCPQPRSPKWNCWDLADQGDYGAKGVEEVCARRVDSERQGSMEESQNGTGKEDRSAGLSSTYSFWDCDGIRLWFRDDLSGFL